MPGTDPHAGAPQRLPAAKTPVGTGAAPAVALLLGLGLVALAVVGVQTLLASLDLTPGKTWIRSLVETADGLDGSSALVLVVGIVSVLLGLAALVTALKPRPGRGVALDSTAGVFLRRRDVAALVRHAAKDVEAIEAVKVGSGRRVVRVKATTAAEKDRAPEIRDSLTARLAPTLDAFERAPRLKVSLRHHDPDHDS